MTNKSKIRKENALSRLKVQLESGKKDVKGVDKPLTDKDIKRINKEVETLGKKLK